MYVMYVPIHVKCKFRSYSRLQFRTALNTTYGNIFLHFNGYSTYTYQRILCRYLPTTYYYG